jgi:polar amino acid transport system substrate-binding protein
MKTTILRVYLPALIQFLIVFWTVFAVQAEDVKFSQFRHTDVGAIAPLEALKGQVKLLTDQDYAPFSYQDANGKLVGLSVDIALEACAAARVVCEMNALPFAELVPALLRGDGDVIISGVRTTPALLEKTIMTRPYYFSSGRFLTRVGMPFETPDIRSLAGRRIGYVKNTSHQAFLEKYYDRSALTPFESEAEMFESLRTGKLDAAFTDSLHASFWIKGTSSRQCCVELGKSFIDRTTFTRGLSFLVRQDHETLREYLDYALDKIEENGKTAKIMALYLPAAPF